jgi:hypothetical protein
MKLLLPQGLFYKTFCIGNKLECLSLSFTSILVYYLQTGLTVEFIKGIYSGKLQSRLRILD